MTSPARRHPLRTSAFLAVLLILPAAGAEASRLGRDGFSGNPATNGGATCSACHAPGAPRPVVTLTGPETMAAGSTARFRVRVSGGPAATSGFDVSSSGVGDSDIQGKFAPVNGDSRILGGEITHARPKPFSGAAAVFEFNWTAPPYRGPVTLYAAGNSSDGHLDIAGDGVGTARLRLQVQGGPLPPPTPPPGTLPTVRVVPFATGLERPVAIAHAGDARVFVAEQPGRIRIIEPNGTVRSPPFLNVASRVESGHREQGLLGLAFHPDFASNGFYYVYYTIATAAGDRSRVSRFRAARNQPDRSWLSSERVLLEFPQPFDNHNGGDLHFGPDGYLYIASGDGGNRGDPNGYAQNPAVLLGKILRIDVNGSGGRDCGLAGDIGYDVPADNAFVDGRGKAGCDEIFALGVRNPWRMSFDRRDGDLWIADVGQDAVEEVNRIPAGSPGGLNLGWRCFEGNQSYRPAGCNAAYFPPVHVATHDAGFCSITGGYVYRGARSPALFGRYVFSDFCDPALHALSASGGWAQRVTLLPAGAVSQPVAFGEDADGELLIASFTGEVSRIRGPAADNPDIGEAGAISVSQANSEQWHDVRFGHAYRDPVVVAGPPTRNGVDPLVVRIRNVTATGFQVQLDEWDYRDGAHTVERIGYVVVERGSHSLVDGRRLIAGRSQANDQWQNVTFPGTLAAAPVVVTQTASARGGQAVTERLRNVSASGFQVRLQEEEENDGSHALETLHWLAVTPGTTRDLAAGRLTISGTAGAAFAPGQWYSSAPVLLAAVQGYRGGDPVALRVLGNDGSSVELVLEEEQSADPETDHADEPVGYLMLRPGELQKP